MKSLGVVLIIIGSIWALIAFNFDTSVSTGLDSIGSSYELPSRVNNLGLMAERQNHLIFSGLTILVGILLFGFGSIANNPSNNIDNKISCPFCAEQINAEAKFCRFCQKELPIKENLTVEDSVIASVSNEPPIIYKSCNSCRSLNSSDAIKCIVCDSPLQS